MIHKFIFINITVDLVDADGEILTSYQSEVIPPPTQYADGVINKAQIGGAKNTLKCGIQKDLFGHHRILSVDVSHLNEKTINIPDSILSELDAIIKELKNIKIQFCVSAEFVKDDVYKTCNFSNSAEEMSPSFLTDGIDRINGKIERMSQLGSEWRLTHILEISFVCVKFNNMCRLSGSQYIESPKYLQNQNKGVVNIKNDDNLCFLYSILATTKADVITRNRQRVNNYIPYLDTLKYNLEDMPMKFKDIPKFEKENGLAINVLSYKENVKDLESHDVDVTLKHPNIDIIHRTKVEGIEPIYLILLEKEERSHYLAVLNLNKLLNVRVKTISKVRMQCIWCKHCLNGFRKKPAYEKHVAICRLNMDGTTLYSVPKNLRLEFTDWSRTVTPPFVIYADFEAVLPNGGTHAQKHIPISAGALLINNFTGEYSYRNFVGYNCVVEFLQYLDDEVSRVLTYYEKEGKKPMKKLSPIDITLHGYNTKCYLCKKKSAHLVMDHNHWTGEYIGAACSKCNLSRKIRKTLPVLFHNLRGYDMHHILKYGLSHFKKWKLSCIPTSTEKFISLIVNTKGLQLKFIDSYQFLSDSLSNAIKTLSDTPITKMEMQNDKICKSKGIFPYDFATSLDVLQKTLELPPIWDGVSEKEYELAKDIWKEMGCKSLLDYMLVYMKLDVFLLADVFQQFRRKSILHNRLEPLNFFGIPGMSWASALMTLEKPIQLLNDMVMYNFFESGIRGGMTFVNKHHVVASSTTQLLYIDINNLYGWALSEKLPWNNCHWVREEDFDGLLEQCKNEDISKLDYGCTFEVDLTIPEEFHDYLNDLPPAPEKMCPPNSKVEKLILSFKDKFNYVIHWRLLKEYMELGVVVTKVHRIVRFDQKEIFQKYVSTNTDLRSESTNDFDKNYYKLLNNSLYGKCVENLKKRINLRLCNTADRLVTYTSKPTFKRTVRIDKDLIAVQLNKENIVLDRPSYIGQTVLDLSKLRMYQLQYKDLAKYRKQFNCEINIVAGDTDSFFLECKNVDLKTQLLPAMMKDYLLDTSNYPKGHTLHSTRLDSVVGKFKDESKGEKTWKEWIFLRPKCYKLLSEEEHEAYQSAIPHLATKADLKTMKAKGISLLGSAINFQSYMDAYLNESEISIPQKRFESNNHQIFTKLSTKVALSANDDKRKWIEKNKSVAYGHYLDDTIFPPPKIIENVLAPPITTVDVDIDYDGIENLNDDDSNNPEEDAEVMDDADIIDDFFMDNLF